MPFLKKGVLKRGENMELNKICLCAIVLFFLFPIIGFFMHHFWKMLILGIIISVIVGVIGWFKGDEIAP